MNVFPILTAYLFPWLWAEFQLICRFGVIPLPPCGIAEPPARSGMRSIREVTEQGQLEDTTETVICEGQGCVNSDLQALLRRFQNIAHNAPYSINHLSMGLF